MRERADLIRRAFALEYFTIAWMIIEAGVAIGSGIGARSVTLVAFGVDSIIEVLSALVLVWRLGIELRDQEAFPDAIETRASKIGAVLLLALCIYVITSAGWSLCHRVGQEFSLLGLAVALAAIPVMSLLARQKLEIADRIQSHALRADAIEAVTCGYLSVVVVIGLSAQALLHAWWVDSVTSLTIVWLLIREAREAWQTDGCC